MPSSTTASARGLAVDLAQSPFLNMLSEQKVRQALRLMGRSPNERVTRALGQEVCGRQGSKAYLAGSISALGSSYSLVLDAVNCRTGDSLARARVEADSKEHVLPALGEAATKLRRGLGESLASIEKFDVPLQKATTPSLEALRAYTLGYKATRLKGPVEAIPFYKRAESPRSTTSPSPGIWSRPAKSISYRSSPIRGTAQPT